MTAYGIMAAATVAVAFALYGVILRKRKLRPGLALAALPLAAVLALLCARAGYAVLLQLEDLFVWGEWSTLTDFQARRLCFVTGAVGACLGVALAARLCRVPGREAMDAFAAPGALLVAGLRLAEGQLGKFGAGVLVEGEGWLNGAPFTIADTWGDRYVAVFFWEAVAALVIFLFALLMREGRPGVRFEKTAFALCLCQVLLENMRNQSMRWGFVYVEQLLCAVILMALVWRACRRHEKKQGRYRPCLWMACCMVGVVGEEFARQKGGSELLAEGGYFLMAAILLGMALIYRNAVRETTSPEAR